MNDLIIKDNEIKNMIYEIRGKQVMLDSDLAKLYQCKNGTKEINQAVKNNLDKFPEYFSWILTDIETLDLRSNFLTANVSSKSRTNPRVFTEQGIYMLSTILKSKVATQVTISIMDAFVAMRHFIGNNLNVQNSINNMVLKHDNEINKNTEDIKLLQDTFNNFIKPEEKNKIFFKGQIYDAYSLLIDIFNKSKKEIIIIDNYADKKLLDILSKVNKKVIIYSKNMDNELIEKYNKQYDNVEVKNIENVHDRFIIIDRKVLYHSGSSFKDIGKSCFAISKIEEKNIIKSLLDNL